MHGGCAGLNDLCYVLRRVGICRLSEDSLGLGGFAAALGRRSAAHDVKMFLGPARTMW